MRTINCIPERIELNPLNYIGLRDKPLYDAVRNFSTIKLQQSIPLEKIEIELSQCIKKTSDISFVNVVFFGQDLKNNEETLYSLFSLPFQLYPKNQTILPSEAFQNHWNKNYHLNNNKTLIVERIGFYATDQPISFIPIAKIVELEEEDGFIPM